MNMNQTQALQLPPLPKEWDSPPIRYIYELAQANINAGRPVVGLSIEFLSRIIAISGIGKGSSRGEGTKKITYRGVDAVTENIYKLIHITPLPIMISTSDAKFVDSDVASLDSKKPRTKLVITFVITSLIDGSSVSCPYAAAGVDPTAQAFDAVIANAYALRDFLELTFSIPTKSVDKIVASLDGSPLSNLTKFIEELDGTEKTVASNILAAKLSAHGLLSAESLNDKNLVRLLESIKKEMPAAIAAASDTQQ